MNRSSHRRILNHFETTTVVLCIQACRNLEMKEVFRYKYPYEHLKCDDDT